MVSPLLVRSARDGRTGRSIAFNPAEAGWDYIGLEVHSLGPGDRIQRPGDERELAVVLVEGGAALRVQQRELGTLGGRRALSAGGLPGVAVIGPGQDLSVTATSDACVVLASAPGGPVRDTRIVAEGEMRVEERGDGPTARRVQHLLPPDAVAGRLILVEVFTPAGNWSSYPPHKHDTEDPPNEALLEETYFYRFADPRGFALQRIYTADRLLDETIAANDGDVVLVPRGYHAVAAAPGYDCYYLNVMAGPARRWNFTTDPDHAWLMNWDPTLGRGAPR